MYKVQNIPFVLYTVPKMTATTRRAVSSIRFMIGVTV